MQEVRVDMRRLPIALASSCLLLATLTACTMRERAQTQAPDAPVDAAPTLAASYSVNGFDPQGTEYGGNLTIRPGDLEGQYYLQWIVTGSIQQGTGALSGNQLLVRWRTVEGIGPGASGVATYTITTKGELYGPRLAAGLAGVGREMAFPNPEN